MVSLLKLYQCCSDALWKYKISGVRSPDGDTYFFDIKAGDLQGDTLVPLLFIIILVYVLRTSVDKHPNLGFTNLGFTLSERLSRGILLKNWLAYYADDFWCCCKCVLFSASSRKYCQILEFMSMRLKQSI